MKYFRVYLTIAILVVLLCVGIAYQFEQRARDARELAFTHDQRDLAANTSRMLANLNRSNLVMVEMQADWLMGIKDASRLVSPEMATLGRTILERFSGYQPVMAYFVTPEQPVFTIGTGTSARTKTQLTAWAATYWDMITTQQEMVVVPLYADPEIQLTGMFKAFYEGDKLRGVWALAVNVGESVRFAEANTPSEYGRMWLIDNAGQVIYHPNSAVIGQNVADLHADYPELLALEQRALSEPEGSGSFTGMLGPGLPEGRQLAAWGRAAVGQQFVVILLAESDDLVDAPLILSRRQVLLVGLLLGITFLVAAALFYVVRQEELKMLVARRTAELRQLTQDLEGRVQERTAELESERAQLQLVLSSMEDSVVYRKHGQAKYANAAFSRLTGYTDRELCADSGGVSQAIVQPNDLPELAQAVTQALIHEQVWHGDMVLRRKDGSAFEAEMIVAPAKDEAGKQLGSVEIVRDVTEVNALRRYKDRFFSNAAHQLRLPLANLKTRLYLMRRQPERQDYHLEVIDNSLDYLTDLVSDLVDLARYDQLLGNVGLLYFDLTALMSSILADWRSQTEERLLILAVDIPDHPVNVLGDYQRFNQMINNLLGYTFERAPAGSVVEVQVAEVVLEFKGQPHVQIKITGSPAMEATEYAQLFEPFYHISEDSVYNTGLRLALAQRIASSHHGTIIARGEDGDTTSLIVCLPLKSARG